MGTASGSRDKLDTGRAPEGLRVDLQLAVLPDGVNGLRIERGGHRPAQRSMTPWISIAIAQLDVWIEVIFAVRSGRKKRGVIRPGLSGC